MSKSEKTVGLRDNKGKLRAKLPGSTTLEDLVKIGLRPEHFKFVPEGTPLPDGWAKAEFLRKP